MANGKSDKYSFEDLFSQAVKGFENVPDYVQKASNVLFGSLDTQIGKTPYKIVYQEDRVKLKHNKPKGGAKFDSPLLINYATFIAQLKQKVKYLRNILIK